MGCSDREWGARSIHSPFFHGGRSFMISQGPGSSPASAGDMGQIPGSGRSLEKGVVTHSCILAWEIPRTEESVGYSPWSCKESDVIEQLNNKNPRPYRPV